MLFWQEDRGGETCAGDYSGERGDEGLFVDNGPGHSSSWSSWNRSWARFESWGRVEVSEDHAFVRRGSSGSGVARLFRRSGDL